MIITYILVKFKSSLLQIVPGSHNPFQGPGIRFELGAKPVFNPGS